MNDEQGSDRGFHAHIRCMTSRQTDGSADAGYVVVHHNIGVSTNILQP